MAHEKEGAGVINATRVVEILESRAGPITRVGTGAGDPGSAERKPGSACLLWVSPESERVGLRVHPLQAVEAEKSKGPDPLPEWVLAPGPIKQRETSTMSAHV